MIAILFTDGQVNLDEIYTDCQKGSWVPVLTVNKEGEPPTVICFTDQKTARSFAKRNIPAEWLRGAVNLTDYELDLIRSRGWKIEILSFPRLMKDLPGIRLGFEIVELKTKPEVYISR